MITYFLSMFYMIHYLKLFVNAKMRVCFIFHRGLRFSQRNQFYMNDPSNYSLLSSLAIRTQPIWWQRRKSNWRIHSFSFRILSSCSRMLFNGTKPRLKPFKTWFLVFLMLKLRFISFRWKFIVGSNIDETWNQSLFYFIMLSSFVNLHSCKKKKTSYLQLAFILLTFFRSVFRINISRNYLFLLFQKSKSSWR